MLLSRPATPIRSAASSWIWLIAVLLAVGIWLASALDFAPGHGSDRAINPLSSAGLLSDDGVYLWQDGDRQIPLRLVESLPAGTLAASTVSALGEWATRAATAYTPLSGDSKSTTLGERADNWFISDTGQLYLLVGGVIALFDAHLDQPAIDAVFRRHGIAAEHTSPVGEIPNAFLFATASDVETLRLVDALSSEPSVSHATPNMFTPRSWGDSTQNHSTGLSEAGEQRCLVSNPPLSDPYSHCLWHLDADTAYRYNDIDPVIDINIDDVWDTTMGEGITAAIVEEGVNAFHEDLADNFDNANSDLNGGDIGLSSHGTAVAGIVGARDNALGGRGVAPRVNLVQYIRNVGNTSRHAAVFTLNKEIVAVSNHSYGKQSHNAANLMRETKVWKEAIATGLDQGFDGKGTVYVVTAGNGRGLEIGSGWTGLEEMQSHHGTIPVCAVNALGSSTSYSERGPSLWVCAPSWDTNQPGIFTSAYDWRTEADNTYTDSFSGTSAAAPMVTGVVALIRSVNHDLTWRDVKLILANTAQLNDPTDAGWESGEEHYGPGDGQYSFNNRYGFGVVNAKAGVEAARNWPLLPQMQTTTAEYRGGQVGLPRVGAPTEVTLDVQTGITFTEYVEVTMDLRTEHLREFTFTLVSPSGSESILLPAAPRCSGCGHNGAFTFGTSRHLGEDPSGTWTLKITNGGRGVASRGHLADWEVVVYGHAESQWITLTASPPQVEEGDSVELTATLSGDAPTQDMVIPVILQAGTAATADYDDVTSITIPAGASSGSATITTVGDNHQEGDETFTATLGVLPPGYRTLPAATKITIIGHEPEVRITAGPGVTEGGAATFAVTANPPPTADLEVNVTMSESGDFGITPVTSVTVPPSGSATLTVPTSDDSLAEPDGSVTATIAPGTGYVVSTPAGAATVMIADQGVPGPEVLFASEHAVEEQRSRVVSLDTSRHKGAISFALDGPDANHFTLYGSARLLVFSGQKYDPPVDADKDGVYEIGLKVDDSQAGSTYVPLYFTVTNAKLLASAQQQWDKLTLDQRQEALAEWQPSLLTPAFAQLESEVQARVVRFYRQPRVMTTPSEKTEISVAGGSAVAEGDDATFTLTANPAPSAALTVSVTAAQSGDFGIATGLQTITIPTTGHATLTLSTSDDQTKEPDGSALLRINGGADYTVSSTQAAAAVAISDNDTPLPAVPDVSIIGRSGITEGDTAEYVITARPAPAAALTVDIEISQKGDFGVGTGLQTITIPTSGRATLSLSTSDDRIHEPHGSVTVTVIGGTGYTLSSTQTAAAVAISDNDPKPPDCEHVPADTVTVTEVIIWRTAYANNYLHVLRWNRVLAALGEDINVTPMTVEESRAYQNRFKNSRWDRTTRTLEALLAHCSDEDRDDLTPTNPEISISSGPGITEGETARFTITADPAPTAPLTLLVSVDQTGDLGLHPGAQGVTIPISGSVTLTVRTYNDQTVESDSSVFVSINRGNGYTVSSTHSAAFVAVSDDDLPPPDDPVSSTCEHLPADAVTAAEIIVWRGQYSNAPHVLRWNRVLATLGEDIDVTPMTVEESAANWDRFKNSRWDRTTRTLQALAQCPD